MQLNKEVPIFDSIGAVSEYDYLATLNGGEGVFIQWKGTNVCCDITCPCGSTLHFDGFHLYCFRCPNCKNVYALGSHVRLYQVSEKAIEGGIIQTPEPELED